MLSRSSYCFFRKIPSRNFLNIAAGVSTEGPDILYRGLKFKDPHQIQYKENGKTVKRITPEMVSDHAEGIHLIGDSTSSSKEIATKIAGPNGLVLTLDRQKCGTTINVNKTVVANLCPWENEHVIDGIPKEAVTSIERVGLNRM